MNKSPWRIKSSKIIAQVLKDNKDATHKEIRKALREVYPFGQKKYWPYKVWLDEIRFQLGLPRHKWKKKNKAMLERQLTLFSPE